MQTIKASLKNWAGTSLVLMLAATTVHPGVAQTVIDITEKKSPTTVDAQAKPTEPAAPKAVQSQAAAGEAPVQNSSDDEDTSADKKKPGDKYKSLTELFLHFHDGKDYEIVSNDTNSWVTIVSPHGGSLEPGTSQLAALVAENKYNLFDFRVMPRRERIQDLHITSTNFRHPTLTKLLEKSRTAVSIHGMRDRGPDGKTIYIGGLNNGLIQLVAQNLKDAGFAVDADPPQLRGKSKENFVNCTKDGGVQLELSRSLRDEMSGDATANSQRRNDFAHAIQKALDAYKFSK